MDREWGKLQALVYDILPWRKVPESDARSVGMRAQTHLHVHTLEKREVSDHLFHALTPALSSESDWWKRNGDWRGQLSASSR